MLVLVEEHSDEWVRALLLRDRPRQALPELDLVQYLFDLCFLQDSDTSNENKAAVVQAGE